MVVLQGERADEQMGRRADEQTSRRQTAEATGGGFWCCHVLCKDDGYQDSLICGDDCE